MTEREKSWSRCPYCGTFFQGMRESSCGDCLRSFAEYSDTEPVQRYEPRYKVVEDPLPPEDGGFRVGAGFSTNDHKSNLRWSAYTPGTVLNDTKNNVTLKIYNKDNGQRAIRQVQT